ncbi:MAG: polysaccharide deacetylase [Gemmatimonadetes bacterium]|nr:MAG: polysaccharide deacetylase [Candidatus Rokubacteria bacterium]PYP36806.1 MAG: polysaccharide deacetylase [Gemmatimonadota bacterium]
MSALTIVMYHYIRDLARSRYPGLKALTVKAFEGQLDYIIQHYRVCAVQDVVAARRGERRLPPNACLLTFDDGFLDHFTTALPRLLDRGLPASFYPPAVPVEGGRVLDTHKIHFILAACPDRAKLARQLLDMIEGWRGDVALPPTDALWRQHAVGSRFDGPEVVFVKRVLQRGLPTDVRSVLTQRLFEEFVGVDVRAFAQELYMDLEQLRCLRRLGMDVGGHGAEHVWLDALDRRAQDAEISRTLAFLARVHGGVPVDWVMCYPFGSYDETTLELLRSRGCALGLTTRAAVAPDLGRPLELPRLDTNDLPTSATAEPGAWTVEALRGGHG